ncbi:hormogonium polysaccharide biosynthesis glycosyltransferase HpsE [Coleofasciculus sp. F4-SAH-05]|uniref:hormogonium polysaccharide biosynthesis glycosyltransferase HpsE n=1 Tax=Coleofasciculus sp. F4-SAH-05 TaxID=3069525 RepID=UPI0032F6AC17
MMIELTVAICTYNGAARLPQVLDGLVVQIDTEPFVWEIIVIDNNSRDRTADVVHQYQAQSNHPIHYYFEAKQGLAFARRLGIKKAQGDWVAFLDDDNLPSPNWVSSVYSFAQSHPQAGAYGGQIQGVYETNPPENFHRIASCLGIIDRGSTPFRYDIDSRGLLPAGAGLVVRQSVWLEHIPDQPMLKGVCGQSVSSKGEDLETLSYIRNAGWEIWHNPDMVIEHHIPRSRLEKDYLLQVFRGIGLSRYPIRRLQFPDLSLGLMVLVYLVSDCRKLIIHWIKYGTVLNTDIVAACEGQLFWYSLISPFYHWQQKKP